MRFTWTVLIMLMVWLPVKSRPPILPLMRHGRRHRGMGGGMDEGPSAADEMLMQLDQDKDEQISVEELKRMMYYSDGQRSDLIDEEQLAEVVKAFKESDSNAPFDLLDRGELSKFIDKVSD